jgi:hypothetical protein
VNEVNGEKPISNWIVVKLADFVRNKYGLDIKVSIDENYKISDKTKQRSRTSLEI